MQYLQYNIASGPSCFQVRPGPAPLSELQSQLNDMLDDSASDDTASLSQLTFMQSQLQPAMASAPNMQQGAALNAVPFPNSMQVQLAASSPVMLLPNPVQDLQLKTQLQVQ